MAVYQNHPQYGIYKYPAIISSPVVLEDKLIYREVNSHGGNEGQARNLVYIDKKTGETLARKYAGHIDYRTQVAPVASNGKYTVYPFGIHDIYNTPPICQNLNRLICADVDNNRTLWDLNVGDIDVLAEPVLTDYLVFQGTTEGYLYAVNLSGERNPLKDPNWDHGAARRVAWQFKANGSVNTTITLVDEVVYFGSNGGSIYALTEYEGKVLWETIIPDPELGARKQFTVHLYVDGKLYIGGANKKLYRIDAKTGAIEWETELSDWIRAKPAMTSEGVIVAAVDGKMACVSTEGELR